MMLAATADNTLGQLMLMMLADVFQARNADTT